MWNNCVHECRHPLWGGAGTCHNSSGGGDTPAFCECDAGYASRDAWGNASCVPRLVLVSFYIALATSSVLAAVLVVWDLNRHRRLPVRYQVARKMVIRTRALQSVCVYLIGFAVVGTVMAVRAGETGYADLGIWHVQYLVLTPSLMFGMVMMAEYWVHSLPSQIVSADSFAGMLRHASDSSGVFVLVGLANATPILTLGVLAFFFDKRLMLVGDLFIMGGIICAVILVLFVAVQTSSVINLAMEKGSANCRAFYGKAKKNLWLQAATLCSTGAAGVAATIVKQLTLAGRRTPVISFTTQILCAHVASVVFALATKHEATSGGGCQSDDQAVASIFTSAAEAARTGVSALSCAGSAMGDLLLPRRSEAHRHNDSTPHDNAAVAIKSSVGGKTGAYLIPRNADKARVLPAHEDLPVAGGGAVGSGRKKGSAITSADNA